MKAITAAACAVLLSLATGCNTIEGAGKDVKATGSAIERTADESKPK
ncbi:MAG: entericidin A/B family lipoprotein [Casimicrobiaceae bacterium]